jgi:hypothetical protein
MPEWVHTFSGWAIVHREHLTLVASFVSMFAAIVVAVLTYTLATENRILRKAGTEPDVVAYLLPDQRSINLLNLVVANVGRGAAFGVELEFIGDLKALKKSGVRLAGKSKLPILSVLPQDERFVQFFGSFLEFSEIESIPDFTFHVRYQTSKGEVKTGTSRASVADFLGVTRVGNSPEHDTAEALKQIAKSVEGWGGLSRLKVETITAAEVQREQQARYAEIMERRESRDIPGDS